MTVFGCSAIFFGAAAYMAAYSAISGWALVRLWNWFILPFFDVPTLSIAHAVGISLIVSFLTYSPTEAKDGRTTEEKIGSIIAALLRPGLVVLIGYVVQGLM